MRRALLFFLVGSLGLSVAGTGEGGVVLNEILADPAPGVLGDANRDGIRDPFDDEFVELVNTNPDPVFLTGWTLSDQIAVRHLFSSEWISGYGFFVLFGGGDPLGFGAFSVSSSGSLSLNNTGDTLTLYDAGGNPVALFSYGSEGGEDTSLTRSPDGFGSFVQHSSASGSLFSPGVGIDGEEHLSHEGAIPEPASVFLFGTGLLGLAAKKRRLFPIWLAMVLFSFSETAFAKEEGAGAKERVLEANWKEVTHGIPETDFRAIAAHPFDPTHVYVGTSRSVYRTLDGGKGWEKVLSLRGESKAVHQIRIVSEEEILAATGDGLYYSSDRGKSWKRIFRGVGDREREALSVVAVREGIVLGTKEGLFLTRDRGKNWERGGGELSDAEVSFLESDSAGETLYAATPMGLYESKDLSRTWRRIFVTSAEEEGAEDGNGPEEVSDENIFSSEKITSILVEENSPKKILIGTQNGIYESPDLGRSWSRADGGGLGNSEIHHLLSSNGLLYAATEEGVFVFWEGEGRWRDMSRGLTEGRVVSLDGLGGRPDSFFWALTQEGVYRLERASGMEAWKEELDEILSSFKNEPTIEDIQEAAIRYAEVHPEKILAWRRAASRKALLPEVSTGVDVDIDRNVDLDRGGTGDPDFFIIGPDERNFNWDVNVSWDFGELLWNDDQTSIDVRSKLMVQLRDDILDEVTRLYFERRRLQIELLLEPPETLREKIEKHLRLEELTAGIDSLTGGYLSRAVRSEL